MPFRRGMKSILLHQLCSGDALEQKWNKRHFVFLRKVFIDLLEGLYVVGSVVRRQRHPRKQHAGAGLLHALDNLFKVAPCSTHRQTAQAVIATQLDDYDFRLYSEGAVETRQPSAGRVSADACIYHTIVQPSPI